VGQNVRVDYRWGHGNVDAQRNASELVALGPDVILAHSSGAVTALLQTTRTVPIVFTLVADPVGGGYVESLAHPGGNVTGFTNFEYAIAGKWLELLKEVAPAVRRVAVLRESAISAGPAQFSVIQIVAPSFDVELRPVDVSDAAQIERAITAFAGESAPQQFGRYRCIADSGGPSAGRISGSRPIKSPTTIERSSATRCEGLAAIKEWLRMAIGQAGMHRPVSACSLRCFARCTRWKEASVVFRPV
jgi:ABC transporter substrate binding protein